MRCDGLMHGDPCHHRYIQCMSQPCAGTSFGLTRGSCYSTVHLDYSSSLLTSSAPDCQKGGCGCVMGELRLWKTKKKKNPLQSSSPTVGGLMKILLWRSSYVSARAAPPCVEGMQVQHGPSDLTSM